MLQQLPTEIIQHIVSHLPTASSIINLALTNKRLHRQLASDDYSAFRTFVQNNFPTIRTPPHWKEAACILTTRARAWDRRAFIARALEPPAEQPNPPCRIQPIRPSVGYAPVLDSYETWHESGWADRKEVLAWGAAGRVIMRVKESGKTEWRAHRVRNDHLPHNDILDIRLLRPDQRGSRAGEEVIIRRANKDVTKLTLHDNHVQTQNHFDTSGLMTECMDVSHSSRPLLAVCTPECIQVFDATAAEQRAKATTVLNIQHDLPYTQRKRCTKFLNDERLAVAVQYVEGRGVAPIEIYRMTPDGSPTSPERCFPARNEHGSGDSQTRTSANAIAPLDDVASLSGRPGEVFLSGWSDGIVRLYDTRSPVGASIDFHDGVDDGQILSLLPIGHERFLAASVQNACLKTFDLRMPGARVYSYLNAGVAPASKSSRHRYDSRGSPSVNHERGPVDDAVRRQLNVFLAIRMKYPTRLWQPLPKQSLSYLPRYRGAVYSLSAPSPASPTVFAGVENHVIELDFVSTDDVRKGRQNIGKDGLDYEKENGEQILNLSCYERPRPGHESTDPVLLRNQVGWYEQRKSFPGVTEEGWDERWRLATRDHRSSSYRRQKPASQPRR